nr:hypothetical protein B0A51_18002 [Rachicladosporium sp. CCFEE 5018]
MASTQLITDNDRSEVIIDGIFKHRQLEEERRDKEEDKIGVSFARQQECRFYVLLGALPNELQIRILEFAACACIPIIYVDEAFNPPLFARVLIKGLSRVPTRFIQLAYEATMESVSFSFHLNFIRRRGPDRQPGLMTVDPPRLFWRQYSAQHIRHITIDLKLSFKIQYLYIGEIRFPQDGIPDIARFFQDLATSTMVLNCAFKRGESRNTIRGLLATLCRIESWQSPVVSTFRRELPVLLDSFVDHGPGKRRYVRFDIGRSGAPTWWPSAKILASEPIDVSRFVANHRADEGKTVGETLLEHLASQRISKDWVWRTAI